MSNTTREATIIAAILMAGSFLAYALGGPGPRAASAEHAAVDTQDKGQEKEADKDKKGKIGKKGKDAKHPGIRLQVTVKGGGKAIVGATVFIKPANGKRRQSSTNTQGIATFSDVPAGKMRVQVTAAGYQPYDQDNEFAAEAASLEVALEKDGMAAAATIPRDAALRHFPAPGR